MTESTPSLAEQWALQGQEDGDSSTNPEEAVKHVETEEASDSKQTESTTDVDPTENLGASDEASTEKIDETLVAEESSEAIEEASEEETASEATPVVKIETAPADFRFPTTNQTRHCFTRYVEYHRCINAKGEGAPECDKFAKYYRSLCPSEWVERWNEQRENGTFPGPL
ncbi:uncharacterized protein LOC144701789 [Wolffia australiana]